MGAQSMNFDSIEGSCKNLATLASSLDKTIDTVNSAVSKIAHPAWEGTAAENFRKELQKLADNLPVANQQLALSVLFLASCADGYKSLGDASVQKLKDLIGGQDYIDSIDVSKLPDPDLTIKVEEDTSKKVESTNTGTEQQQQTATLKTTSTGTQSTNSTQNYYTSSNSYSSYSATPTSTSTAATIGTLTNLTTTALAGQTVEIPSSISQGAYTVTGYDYWINSGRQMTWKSGTKQAEVAEIWKKQGSRFKNGIAVINVDGEDRYLIAVTTKFGVSGDCIDVKLADGSVIKCIIGDSKGSDAGSEWGHVLSGSTINVLEFEVQREKYLASGNPTTAKWGLDWDSNQPVKSMTNKGSIIGATQTDKMVVMNSTTTDSSTTAVTV